MSVLSQQDWLQIAQQFEQLANFQNCIGWIDSKHVRIVNTAHIGSLCYNYKHISHLCYWPCVMQTANYDCAFIDIGTYGKNCVSCIFQNSVLRNKISENELNVPDRRGLTGGRHNILPHVFIGDEDFGLSTYVTRPYSGKHLSLKERVYNYGQSKARRFIERNFEILTNKWRIFHRPRNASVDCTHNLVNTCVKLHNFVHKRDGFLFEYTFSYEGLQDNVQLQHLAQEKHLWKYVTISWNTSLGPVLYCGSKAVFRPV